MRVAARAVETPKSRSMSRRVSGGPSSPTYAVWSETRHEHLAELRRLYGFRSFAGGAARELGDRLREGSATGAVERGPGAQVRRGLPSHANHPAGHDDDRADLRRRTGRRGTPGRSPHRRAGPARASARTSIICSKRRSTPGVTRFYETGKTHEAGIAAVERTTAALAAAADQ